MPIYIGGNELDNLAIGANELDKAYLGTSLLYEKTNPIASVPRRVKLMTDMAKHFLIQNSNQEQCLIFQRPPA